LSDGEEGVYLRERLADDAIAFVREHADESFYLNYCPYSVHYPMEAPEALVEKYRGKKGIKNPTYAAMIEGMDRALGRFLEALDEAGLEEETLVIFKSDNGGYNGDNRPLRGFKGMMFEGGIRIPWIVRWPGVVEAGTTCEVPVISMDCYPTILEAVGIAVEAGMNLDGESLLPLLKQTGGLEREAIFWHYPNYAFHKKNRLGSAIRLGNYKLIRRYDDGSLELYDLAEDIGEKRNLSSELPEVAARLNRKLGKWLGEVDAKLPTRGE
jgi:arylsulfatase A